MHLLVLTIEWPLQFLSICQYSVLSKYGVLRPKHVVNKSLYTYDEHRTLFTVGAVFFSVAVYQHATNKSKVQLRGLEPPETSTVWITTAVTATRSRRVLSDKVSAVGLIQQIGYARRFKCSSVVPGAHCSLLICAHAQRSAKYSARRSGCARH